MRVTVDTNFLVSATQWDYSIAHRLLEKFIIKEVDIFSTKEILEEFSEILRRDFLYSEEEASKLVEKILQVLILVTPTIKLEVIKEDSDDNKILECALESNSEYIISYDKHLLKIKEFRGIKIIKPDDFPQ